MGLFFRKSIKLGPVRLNLGKSGIGASVGVKGLRVGTTARGRGYVSGGRGGVYFRKSLGVPSQASAGTPAPGAGYGFIIVLLVGVAILCALIALANKNGMYLLGAVIFGIFAVVLAVARRRERASAPQAEEEEERPNPYRESHRAEVRISPEVAASVGLRTFDVPAVCIADDTAPNGVRVEIQGATVGHLPEEAARWVLALGGRAYECRGRIFGRTLILDIPPTQGEEAVPTMEVTPRVGVSGSRGAERDSDPLRARLAEAITAGEAIRIVYHGGSQPGTVREVLPLEVLDRMLRARDVAAGIDKHFLLAKLELASETTTAAVHDPTVRTSIQSADPEFRVDVWGEREYQDVLERICGGRSPPGANVVVTARVVPHDETNYEYPMGVGVEVNGAVVGYFSNVLAWRYRTIYEGPTACRALIVGGWDRGPDDRGHFGVKLDLNLGDKDGPLRPEVVAPFWEHPCEIVGEAQHQAALREIVSSSAEDGRDSPDDRGRCKAKARLVVSDDKTVVVEIGGLVVGRLNPAKSRRYVKIENPPTEVRALIEGGQLWTDRRSPYSVTLHLHLPER